MVIPDPRQLGYESGQLSLSFPPQESTAVVIMWSFHIFALNIVISDPSARQQVPSTLYLFHNAALLHTVVSEYSMVLRSVCIYQCFRICALISTQPI